MSNQAAPAATRPGRAGGAPALLDQLAPVVAALRAATASRAAAVAAASEAEAAGIRAEAERKARAITERANRDGLAAARAAASGRLAEARREGRGAVLAARQSAYESLKQSVVAELRSRLGTPAGVRLRSYLVRLVSEQSGIPAAEQPPAGRQPGAWRVAADDGSTVAALDLEAVVDQALQWSAAEVEELWR